MDSTPALAAILDEVISLVRQVAYQEVMPRFMHVRRELKDDGTLFSEADVAAQRYLAERLPKVIDCPIIGEEMSPDEQRRAWSRGERGVWCIDPIDGTTNFINGLPIFAISVAWIDGGRPRVGVTFNPVTEEMFYAREGGGAYLNGQRLPLRVVTHDIGRGVANIDFKRIPKPLADRIAIEPPFYSQRNFGSSTLEWCYLAAGRLDLYLHGGQNLWDYAAGRVILGEAGGHATTLEAEPIDDDAPWQRSVVAALDAEVFTAWRDWIRAPDTTPGL